MKFFTTKEPKKKKGKKAFENSFVLWKNLDPHPDSFWPEVSNIISGNIVIDLADKALINLTKI